MESAIVLQKNKKTEDILKWFVVCFLKPKSYVPLVLKVWTNQIEPSSNASGSDNNIFE